jgi:hypothetical protein
MLFRSAIASAGFKTLVLSGGDDKRVALHEWRPVTTNRSSRAAQSRAWRAVAEIDIGYKVNWLIARKPMCWSGTLLVACSSLALQSFNQR